MQTFETALSLQTSSKICLATCRHHVHTNDPGRVGHRLRSARHKSGRLRAARPGRRAGAELAGFLLHTRGCAGDCTSLLGSASLTLVSRAGLASELPAGVQADPSKLQAALSISHLLLAKASADAAGVPLQLRTECAGRVKTAADALTQAATVYDSALAKAGMSASVDSVCVA